MLKAKIKKTMSWIARMKAGTDVFVDDCIIWRTNVTQLYWWYEVIPQSKSLRETICKSQHYLNPVIHKDHLIIYDKSE